MKRFLIVFVMFISFSSFANNKGIPTGILYRLSKAILTETQNFITPPKAVRQPAKSGKTAPCTLKCLPKKEKQIVPVTFSRSTKTSIDVLIDAE